MWTKCLFNYLIRTYCCWFTVSFQLLQWWWTTEVTIWRQSTIYFTMKSEVCSTSKWLNFEELGRRGSTSWRNNWKKYEKNVANGMIDRAITSRNDHFMPFCSSDIFPSLTLSKRLDIFCFKNWCTKKLLCSLSKCIHIKIVHENPRG